jgi:glycosyltransferase involved in cell wall biosynthesis
LRILVLSTSFPSDDNDPSGVFIARLLNAIRKRGHFVKVIAPSNGIFYGERVVNGITTFRFPYFIPRSLERLTKGLGGIPENINQSWLARLQVLPMMSAFLIATLSEIRSFDLIYANWLGAGIIGAFAKSLSGKPLVVSFRGDDGYLARDRVLWRVITKWVIRNSAALAPVSRQLNDIIIGLGTPAEKCFLPKFGVDVDMFHPPCKPEQSDESIRVIYVGAIVPKKGVRDLVEAMAVEEFNHVRLALVGDGFYRPELLSIADKMGLKDRVEWMGLQPHGAVAEAMRSADIFCLPSHTEGRPNVVNEAMASGLPVIATRIGGIPDMVEEGQTALLYDAGNVAALRDCLRALVANSSLRKSMGARGRDLLMQANLSWDTTAQDFEKIFDGVLRKNGPLR